MKPRALRRLLLALPRRMALLRYGEELEALILDADG